MDNAPWMQEIGQKSMGEIGDSSARSSSMERKLVRPQKDQAVNCPRCHSTNTKFCYYNNYSLTQPRYFCKNCRRYWTEGGTLRNVPVGGCSRKNKKSSLISTSSSLSMSTIPSTQPHHKLPDLNPPPSISEFSTDHQNPKSHHHHEQGVQDLNLGFAHAPHEYSHVGITQFFEFPKIFDPSKDHVMNSFSSSNSSTSSASLSALNLLRNGIGLNSFIPIAPRNVETNTLFTSSFPFNQESKPSLDFSFDHHVTSNCSRLHTNPRVSVDNITNGSLGFPYGGMKRNSGTNDDEAGDRSKGQENSNGCWNGMLGGGSW